MKEMVKPTVEEEIAPVIARIDLRSFRASVARSAAEQMKNVANVLEGGGDVEDLSPNVVVDLGDGNTIGLQVYPDDLSAVLQGYYNRPGSVGYGDTEATLEVLNKHLHFGPSDAPSGDREWVKAQLEGDELVFRQDKHE